MSRSYKHTPYCGLKKDKFYKTYSNRKLRRKKLYHNLQHKLYRKDFCSYDICDYYTIETKNFDEYYKNCIDSWNYWQNCYGYRFRREEPFPTREECWKNYKKLFLRK